MSFALFLFVYSCKKEISNGEKIDPARKKEMLNYKNGPKVEIINLAQFQKKANLSALGSLKQEFMTALSSKSKKMSIHTDQTYLGFSIATDSIKVIKANGHTMYVFPVELPSKRAVAFQNLTIDEGPDGTIAFVNTYTPTKKWIAEWRKGHSGKFEGDISITYLNLNNGTVPKTTNAPTKSGIKKPNTSLVAQICTSIDYFYEIPYACGSGQHAPWDTGCYLEGDARAGYVYIEYRVTTCVDAPNPGDGSGGTTPTPPGDYNPCPDDPPLVSSKKTLRNKVMVLPPTDCDEVVDCAGVMGGSAYVNPNCGTCMGGTTGITACPPEIRDSLLNDCMKSVLSDIKDHNGLVNGLIRTFTNDDPKYKWNLISGSTSPGTLATTSYWNRTTNTVTTTINNIEFINGSNLAIAKTLLHEGVHAYLVAYFANDTVNATKEYANLVDEFNKKKRPDLNEIHHNEMTRLFVSQIAISLSEYGDSKGYTFSTTLEKSRFYHDLAWGGLFDTKAFQEFPADVQLRIKNLISIEQTGKNLNGVTQPKKGAAGGC